MSEVVKERPSLFSAPMVRALLDGRKTQTRRVVKPQPKGFWDDPNRCMAGGILQCIVDDPKAKNVGNVRDHYIRCPYGVPGDRLWVRETWAWSGIDKRIVDGDPWYRATHYKGEDVGIRWRPSIHMPRWASRILLEVVSVRVERLQNISEADAIAEGIQKLTKDDVTFKYAVLDRGDMSSVHWQDMPRSAKEAYAHLWDQINGAGSWALDPWVWVVEFKRFSPSPSV